MERRRWHAMLLVWEDLGQPRYAIGRSPSSPSTLQGMARTSWLCRCSANNLQIADQPVAQEHWEGDQQVPAPGPHWGSRGCQPWLDQWWLEDYTGRQKSWKCWWSDYFISMSYRPMTYFLATPLIESDIVAILETEADIEKNEIEDPIRSQVRKHKI